MPRESSVPEIMWPKVMNGLARKYSQNTGGKIPDYINIKWNDKDLWMLPSKKVAQEIFLHALLDISIRHHLIVSCKNG